MTVAAADRASALLERDENLAALAGLLAGVRSSSQGRVVLVAGEAGIGKTVLLRRFCGELDRSTRVLWGACDALFTPRPLGPLLDIAERTAGELEDLLRNGGRPYEVARALVRELGVRMATVLVLEDLHWGDEATLDVLRLLARRVESVPALVLASYRDDELDRAHPLRIVLGELATSESISRLKLQPLSVAAVATLAAPQGIDTHELYRKTGGNPFFVTEVVGAGQAQIPVTVRDAVLARVARLDPKARMLLEAVAVAPPQVELWLLEAVAVELMDRLEECLASGMLVSLPGAVAFRHELARLAVEDALASHRRTALHRATLAALASPPSGVRDTARLAHHAEAAGEAEAVLEYAPAAGVYASSRGAHREAAAQYARALRFGDGLPLAARAELFERRSYECHLTEQFDEAIVAQERALEAHRRLGDRRKAGDSLRWLSRVLWFAGEIAAAEDAGRDAVVLLEGLPPSRELALAYANRAQLCMNAEQAEDTVTWATAALELARRLDDTEIVAHALNSLGTVEFLAGQGEGQDKLERSLELAQHAKLEYDVARAYAHLLWASSRDRSYSLADRYLEAGLLYTSERDLDLTRRYLLATSARMQLERGAWGDAADTAARLLRDSSASPLNEVLALVVLALVRARRGDPDVWPALDDALALAESTGELQRIAPVAAARAEAAWLEGEHEAVIEATDAALSLALEHRAPWVAGELAYWRWQAAVREQLPPELIAEPYRLSIAGHWPDAADRWRAIGCPYEAALALVAADNETALRQALGELQALGATPAAAIVARRLRKRGARGVPRGPRRTTLENPVGLTARELDVLALLAAGLRNAQIAQHLVLSQKTIDHHVSAILRKLDVRTRGEAAAEAARLGLTDRT